MAYKHIKLVPGTFSYFLGMLLVSTLTRFKFHCACMGYVAELFKFPAGTPVNTIQSCKFPKFPWIWYIHTTQHLVDPIQCHNYCCSGKRRSYMLWNYLALQFIYVILLHNDTVNFCHFAHNGFWDRWCLSVVILVQHLL